MTNTAYNRDLTERIWNGKVPIQITIEARSLRQLLDNSASTEEPLVWNPLYLEVSRCSYLPLVTGHICKLISQIERSRITDIKQLEDMFRNAWYDHSGVPLKWHYPVGLLHDIHAKTSSDLWTLTLHLDDLPSDEILEKPTVENTRDMYMSMVKEADFLLHGSTKKVMNLSKKDTTQLWQGVMEDAFDDFHAVNKNLRSSSSSSTTALSPASSPSTSSNNSGHPRHVPFKIYLPGNNPVIQELISFSSLPPNNGTEEESRLPTLQDIIKQAIPELTFPLNPRLLIILHGIEMPLDTPVLWAFEHLAYADNFLHIVMKYKE